MNFGLNRWAGMILALCVVTSGCGELPADQSNGTESITAPVGSDLLPDRDVNEDVFTDRKPRKILSPDEKRRAASLLQIYRDSRVTTASDSPDDLLEKARNSNVAQEALDRIDPRIMEVERSRETARQEADRNVDELISEYERKRAVAP